MKLFIMFVAGTALIAGCTPGGSQALFQGKRLMEQGKYPQAVEKLKLATILLGNTNAQSFNYLGLVFHQSGQVTEARKAYERALSLNPDLTEARYNLGCLWLGQNRFDQAKTEFTAFTLRRPTVPEGWLKLGTAQSHLNELAVAEKSFNEALRLNPHDAGALTGLGLLRVQRGRPNDSLQFFYRALKEQTNYRPAVLNIAIVAHQYLKDRDLALRKYREYLAFSPAPENAEEVRILVRELEKESNPAARASATNFASSTPTNLGGGRAPFADSARVAAVPRLAATNRTHLPGGPRVEPSPEISKTAPTTNIPRQAPTSAPPPNLQAKVVTAPIDPSPTASVEVVRLPPEPVYRTAQDVNGVQSHVQNSNSGTTGTATGATPAADTKQKRGLLQRVNPLNLFSGGDKQSPAEGTSKTATQPGTQVQTTAKLLDTAGGSGAPPSGRYSYRSPPRPIPGNRAQAEQSFARGVKEQQAGRLPEAIQAYRQATQVDPCFTNAYFNLGLAAVDFGDLPLALSVYETALVLRPDWVDARYNFALALKGSNYPIDATEELGRILRDHPDDARAHLALGNLYAQQLKDPARARPHYQKVLELDPRHPQAAAIRYWLIEPSH